MIIKEMVINENDPSFLLHKDIYLPRELTKRCLGLQRAMSMSHPRMADNHVEEHFESRAKRYGYGEKDLRAFILQLPSNPIEPFEVEISIREDGAIYVSKFCVRGYYKDGVDLAVAFLPLYTHGLGHPDFVVKTAWCNKSDDLHSTLRSEQYSNEDDIKHLKMKKLI